MAYRQAIQRAVDEGGRVLAGNRVLTLPGLEGGHYVAPTLVEGMPHFQIVCEETLPILYVLKYRDLDEAIAIHNSVTRIVVGHLQHRPAGSGAFSQRAGQRLRPGECQHRHSRCGNRRRLWRRKRRPAAGGRAAQIPGKSTPGGRQ